MSHQWSSEDFCNELEHVSQLLENRPGSQVGQAAMATLKQRLHAVSTWTPSALSELYRKVTDANLPDALKEDMMNEMDGLTAGNQSGLQLSMKPQSLPNLTPYLTNDDWIALEQGNTVDNSRVICERLASLGIKSMKEDTKREAVALLLHILVNVQKQALPGPWEIYYLVKGLVKVFGYVQPNELTGYRAYPPNPNQLSAAFRDRVYGTDQPALKQVSMAALYPKIAVRNTSHLLKNIPEPKEQLASAGSMEDKLQKRLEKFMDRFEDDRDNEHLQKTARNGGPTSLALPNASASHSLRPLPLMDGAPETSLPVRAKPVAASNDTPCLEDFEQQAMEALNGRTASKKNVKGKGLKRPAAAMSTDKKTVCAATVAPQKTATKPVATVWGCKRCRGNPKGCEKCRSPSFKGQRFNGRHEWNEAAAQNGWK